MKYRTCDALWCFVLPPYPARRVPEIDSWFLWQGFGVYSLGSPSWQLHIHHHEFGFCSFQRLACDHHACFSLFGNAYTPSISAHGEQKRNTDLICHCLLLRTFYVTHFRLVHDKVTHAKLVRSTDGRPTYRPTDRPTDLNGPTHPPTDRQTERPKDRQTDRTTDPSNPNPE